MKFEFPPSFDLAVLQADCPRDAETELMLDTIRALWLKDRTLVSRGYDESLEYLGQLLPFDVVTAASGDEVWTWKVPKRWSVLEARLSEKGKTICDYRDHPLHLASYSVPFSGRLSRGELLPHLHFAPDRPAAIPFFFHYYKPDWSFCISYKRFLELGDGPFDVHIDTSFSDGELKVGESVLQGETEQSVILCSHLCHPGQVNDGLSGVVVGLALMNRLAKLQRRRYTYRLVLCPENLGSIVYLHRRQGEIPTMKCAVILEMLGNKNHMKLQYTKQGNTEVDRLAEHALATTVPVYGVGSFRKVICNDEINFDGPGISVPTISLSRWPYPEYHTSDDNPDIISSRYLKESVEVVWRLLMHLERNVYPRRRYTGNLFLSKYGLYEDLNLDDTIERILLSFEGGSSVLEISEKLNIPLERVQNYVEKFHGAGLLDLEDHAT